MQQLTVLHINKFHYMRGGSESVYFKTAHILERHGHRSIFFSMKHPENLPCETTNYFVPYIDFNYSSGLVSQLKSAGRLLYSLDTKKHLFKLLDKYLVDIAHLHNIHHQISPSILYELKKRKIPVVMTLHDYKLVCASYSMLAGGKVCEECTGGKYFKVLKNRCVKNSLAKSVLSVLEMYLHHKILNIYNNVDIFISPSLFLKNKLEEMGFKKEIVYLPNFITIGECCGEPFFINKEKEVAKKNSIVYFGRLSKEKGLITLINAAKLLMQKEKGLDIKIIGEGLLKEKLKEKVKVEEINNVRFLGYLEKEALYQEVHESIAAVLPSEWYENSPMSVLEAFLMGMPVIGARIGGIPELVKDNETGLTFEPGNSKDLASKIEYMVNNPVKTAEMGEKAEKYVRQELNAEKHYQKLMEIYKQAAS